MDVQWERLEIGTPITDIEGVDNFRVVKIGYNWAVLSSTNGEIYPYVLEPDDYYTIGMYAYQEDGSSELKEV